MATASSDSSSRTPSATGLRRQFLEDFLAHRVVDFGERGEVEVDAEQFDQARAQVGLERLDQGAVIGLVQIADQSAQGGRVGGIDRLSDLRDEFGADRAVVFAERRRAGFLSGFPFSHPGLGDRERAPLVRRALELGK